MKTSLFPKIRRTLLRWFSLHKRPLPWRSDYSPYRTWIAEVMMQQTQMDRGVQYFLRWMERFPDIAAVASAPEADLLKAWEGLGYYRRARNIQAAARIIMEKHQGIFPSDPADILALPGIGAYTAGAIASTAFNQRIPCVDGNVERVLSRLENIETPVKTEPARSQIFELAQALIPEGQARDFNQSLMELGALVCRKKPECSLCPLQTWCEAFKRGVAEQRPVPGRKTETVRLTMVCGVLMHRGKLFIQRRQDNDVWAGLWEFPGGIVEAGEGPEQAVLREWREETGFSVSVQEPLATIKHSYTNYRITLSCFLLSLPSDTTAEPEPPVLTAASAYQWVLPVTLDSVAMPAPHRTLVEKYAPFDKGKRKR